MKILVLVFIFFSLNAHGSRVGIIDSGVYFEHDLLSNSPWVNTGEVRDNWVDDDQNGKVDDFNGWNFAENSSEFFTPAHIPFYHPSVYRVLEVASKLASGVITEEEQEFWDREVQGLPADKKKALIAQVNHYGQYAHGTHCAGVVARGNPDAQIMSGKIFPDNQVPEPHETYVLQKSYRPFGVVDWLYDGFSILANIIFVNAANYLNETNMDVANYSLGTPIPMLAKSALAIGGNKNPTDEEIRVESWRIFVSYEKQGKKWMEAAANTLFVIAAGNDHSDNDVLPYFPANMQIDNSISVAATQGYSSLATFSNYGKKYVHVGAPGVNIMSSVPGPTLDMELPMSGTSMAAPFVTMVASKIKDINPALTPLEMKKILMGTVDKKSWLTDHVVSGGVVNFNRAYSAAKLTLSLSVDEAISNARVDIRDIVEAKRKKSSVRITKEMKELAEQFIF